MHRCFEVFAEHEFRFRLGNATFFVASRNGFGLCALRARGLDKTSGPPPHKASADLGNRTSKAASAAVNHLCNVFDARPVSTTTRLSDPRQHWFWPMNASSDLGPTRHSPEENVWRHPASARDPYEGRCSRLNQFSSYLSARSPRVAWGIAQSPVGIRIGVRWHTSR
jgi:hypothetical protein